MSSPRLDSENAQLIINAAGPTTYGTTPGDASSLSRPSIWQRMGNSIAGGCRKIASGTRYAYTHPLATAGKAGAGLLAIAAAAPNTISAWFAASNSNPSKIENFERWWSALPLGKQIHSIANGTAAAIVNTYMNALFFPAAARRLIKVVPKTFKSGRNFLRNLVSIIGGGAGATAASGIAYSSFLWLGMPIAISAAIFNFLIYFATRFVGITNAIKKVKHFLNADIRFQRRCIELLKFIHPKHQPILNDYITNFNLNPSEDSFLKLFTKLNNLCNENGFDDVFRKPTKREHLKKWLGIIFDIVLLLPVTPASLITFAQKGLDGIQMFDKLMSGGSTIENLNIWAKRAIGFVPGLVSSVFYTMSALDLRPAIAKTWHKVRKNKLQAIPAMTLAGATVLSGAAQQGIATNIVANPDNILGFTPDSIVSEAFIVGASTGGVSTNASANFKKFTETPIPTDVTTRPTTPGDDSQLARTIEYWERSEASIPKKPGITKANTRISHATARAIVEMSLFQPTRPVARVTTAPPAPPSTEGGSYQPL